MCSARTSFIHWNSFSVLFQFLRTIRKQNLKWKNSADALPTREKGNKIWDAQASYLSFFLHTDFLRTDFSLHRFGTKTAETSIKLHKLFKFCIESWNLPTWQFLLHKYNLWYLWQIWALNLVIDCNKTNGDNFQWFDVFEMSSQILISFQIIFFSFL